MASVLVDDPIKYPRSARFLPRILKSIYQEWWYFDFLDATNDIQFTATCSVNNPGRIDGGLPKGCDVITITIHGSETHVTPKGTLMSDFEPFDNGIKLGNAFTVTFLDADRVSFQGTDEGAGISFDLVFSRRLPGMRPRTIPVGDRWFDTMRYYPVMPSASVNGAFTIRGTTYTVAGALGYHDHFHGAPTRIGWAPWVTIVAPDFEILAVVVPSRRDFILACIDGESWVSCGRPRYRALATDHDVSSGFQYPTSLVIDCHSRKWDVELQVDLKGTVAFFDLGIETYACPIMWSWNYLASGHVVHEKGSPSKRFSNVPAAMYYMTRFDLIEFDKRANG